MARRLVTVFDAAVSNRIGKWLEAQFEDLQKLPSFVTYFTVLGVSLRTPGDHYLAAAYMLSDFIHKTLMKIWSGPRNVNMVMYGVVAYLTVPTYYKHPTRLHKVYRKTLDANMLPLIKGDWIGYIMNNIKIALPFWLISLMISRRNKKRNKSFKDLSKAFAKNLLYLHIMGPWYYYCNKIPQGRIFLTLSGLLLLITADKSQHNSLVVFTFAQLLYSRLRPFPHVN